MRIGSTFELGFPGIRKEDRSSPPTGQAGGSILRAKALWHAREPRDSMSHWGIRRGGSGRYSAADGHRAITNLVKKKSAIKIAMEMTTTVRVVLLPTPAVPPVVVIPK